ncbi:MAG TPA: CBS domain-containing protein [Melioribacteraceae bacterium]|nr:CBS domain-containing protein [Melioribacteraceae bacterium]
MRSLKDIILSKELYTVRSGSKIIDVVKYMAGHNIGLVPVLSGDGKLLGVFSERDLVRRVISSGLDLHTSVVDNVMTKELVIANINESHQECLKKMKDKKIRHILVIENEKLEGIISLRDLLEIDLQVQQETIEVLHNYIYAK